MAAFYRTAVALLVAACLGLTVADLPAWAADVPPTASLPSIFNGRDLRQYEIVIERDATVRRIVCDDHSVPEATRPLVAFLSARARPQPADFAAGVRRSGADG